MKSRLRNIQKDPLAMKTVLHCFVGFGIFMLSNLTFTAWESFSLAARLAVDLVQLAVFCCAMKLYINKGLGAPLSHYRISHQGVKKKWVVAGICAPAGLLLFYLLLFPGRFARGTMGAAAGIAMTLINAGIGAGLTEEILFRGLMLRLFETRWSRAVAVLLSSFLFALAHVGNAPGVPLPEILWMLAAYTAAGITFALITLRENSIASAVIMHACWNIIAESNILRVIVSPHQFDPNAIINFTLAGRTGWLTGGFFGISANLPAVIAFLSPLLVLICENRKPIPNRN